MINGLPQSAGQLPGLSPSALSQVPSPQVTGQVSEVEASQSLSKPSPQASAAPGLTSALASLQSTTVVEAVHALNSLPVPYPSPSLSVHEQSESAESIKPSQSLSTLSPQISVVPEQMHALPEHQYPEGHPSPFPVP